MRGDEKGRDATGTRGERAKEGDGDGECEEERREGKGGREMRRDEYI